MTLGRKVAGLAKVLRQDSSASEKLFRLAQKSIQSLRLSPALSIERCVLVEATKPPKATRGLSDLVVRHAQQGDFSALAALDNRKIDLFRTRLDRGDFVYVGQLDGSVVCFTCFHRGPTFFDDERAIFARWALDDAATFWSYDAVAPLEIRAAGVVAKLFQIALHEIFELHGARRVRGFIHDWNQPSLILHERMGFVTIGKATALGVPGLKWLRWENGHDKRQWLLPRNSDFALPPAVG
jgi:hypothetical protein